MNGSNREISGTKAAFESAYQRGYDYGFDDRITIPARQKVKPRPVK